MFYKIVVVGDPRVGKTTLRRSYMGERLQENYIKTLGVDFSAKKHKDIGFQIWEIAGELSDNSVNTYLLKTSAVIIVFDVMEEQTLKQCLKWSSILNEHVTEDVPVIIVGNKIDLRIDDNSISMNAIKDTIDGVFKTLKSTKNKYIETSALMGQNIEDVFEWIYTVIQEGIKE